MILITYYLLNFIFIKLYIICSTLLIVVVKDGWQFLSTLLTIGFNFLLCNFHLFRKLLNINVKCPGVHSPAFCSTGCMFYKSIVKNHKFALFGLVVSNCFLGFFFCIACLLDPSVFKGSVDMGFSPSSH